MNNIASFVGGPMDGKVMMLQEPDTEVVEFTELSEDDPYGIDALARDLARKNDEVSLTVHIYHRAGQGLVYFKYMGIKGQQPRETKHDWNKLVRQCVAEHKERE